MDDADVSGLAGLDPRRLRRGQLVELLSVALMSITVILTAWSGFQSAKWGGVMSTSFSEAGASRTESVRMSTIAGQQASVDVAVFTSWIEALAAGDDDLAGFLRERFTDRLDTATTAWEATDPLGNPESPATPFDMSEYVLDAADEAAALEAAAEESSADARTANQRSDNYVVMSVLFAAVIFFGALSTKLASERGQTILLGLAFVGLIVGVVVLSTFPVEV